MEKEDVIRLASLIDGSVAVACKGSGRVAVAFSGGLDSGTIAHVAKRTSAVVAYTVVADEGAKDARTALDAASRLDIDHVMLIPSKDELREAIGRITNDTGISDGFTLSFELPLYFVLFKAKEEVILSGQGADELFGGYARYLRMTPKELEDALRRDPASAIALAGKEIVMAKGLNKRLHHPFLDDGIVSFALGLPTSAKVSGGSRKVVLREAARHLGVDESIAAREKRAAQYGSGMQKALKRLGVVA
jgi:asparagine synthase (glutamine-hydrolysing)